MAKAIYVIEGTIKELKMKDGAWSFKIAGTDGYALRRKKKKDDDKEIRVNVLHLKEPMKKTGDGQDALIVINEQNQRNAIVLEESTAFVIVAWNNINKEYFHLLSLALINGRKCRVCFSVKEEDKKDFDSKNCTISSLALLAE